MEEHNKYAANGTKRATHRVERRKIDKRFWGKMLASAGNMVMVTEGWEHEVLLCTG